MTREVELFLDDTPGETRGVVVVDGRPELLLIHPDHEPPALRLGARSVGRVRSVEPGLRGAFVDLGCVGPQAFLPTARDEKLKNGEAVEVVVTAEAREGKGPVLRRIAAASGDPRLLEGAPDVRGQLLAEGALLGAADAEIITGLEAIRAVEEGVDEALSVRHVDPALGLDMAVQRTRALIAVDIDFAPRPGRDAKKGRATANREGLTAAARQIRLKRWGGLVVVDLVGGGADGAAAPGWAREAFAEVSGAAIGPVSRFGLLQLSLPWSRTPIEEVLAGRGLKGEAADLCRKLRAALLADTTVARITATARPELAEAAGPLIAILGPRAGIRSDPAVGAGREYLTET